MNHPSVKAVFISIILLALGIVLYVLSQNSHFSSYNKDQIYIGNKYFNVYIANTEDKRQLGLGNLRDIDKNQAMLFVFDNPDTYHFWMKDMYFNIDLVCIDMAKEVNKIYENLDPELFPEVYECPFPTKYALELKAGEISGTKIKIGDSIRIESI